MTRVPYVERDDLPPESRAIYDALLAERGYVPHLYRTAAHSPALLRTLVDMTATIRHETTLAPRLRELAILTVARLTAAPIMWFAHQPLARAAGISEAQVVHLADWERHPASFSPEERAVIRYTEAATRDIYVDHGVWDGLRFLADRERVELTLAVAFYNMVARFLVPLDIDLDPEYLHDPGGRQYPSMPT